MPPAVKKPRIRQQRRRRDARLTRKQVLAAWELYRAGYSVPQIAAAGWKQWGYGSEALATNGLYRAFDLEGFRRRTLSEVRQAERCSRCGCPAEERTYACKVCRVRHGRR